VWHCSGPSYAHNRVSWGPLGTVTTRQLVNGSVASSAWPDCVADHTGSSFNTLSQNLRGTRSETPRFLRASERA
jgi:hypothetical protein